MVFKPSERRVYPRRKISLPVKIKLKSYNDFVRQYVTDISAGGVFIVTPTPYEPGDEVDVQFHIGDQQEYFFKVRGVVSRIHEMPLGMAVQFTEIEKSSQDLLEELLNRVTSDSQG